MPYFVYKITPGPTDLLKQLDQLAEFENYRDAKEFAKGKRIELNITYESKEEVKLIMADNALDAEEKLMEKRDKPILQEWEK